MNVGTIESIVIRMFSPVSQNKENCAVLNSTCEAGVNRVDY